MKQFIKENMEGKCKYCDFIGPQYLCYLHMLKDHDCNDEEKVIINKSIGNFKKNGFCDKCGVYKCLHKHTYDAHYCRCKGTKEKKEHFKCTICNEFETYANSLLERHMISCRRKQSKTKLFKCSLCDYKAINLKRIEEHCISCTRKKKQEAYVIHNPEKIQDEIKNEVILVLETIPEQVPEPIPEQVPEPIPEQVPEPIPEPIQEPVQQIQIVEQNEFSLSFNERKRLYDLLYSDNEDSEEDILETKDLWKAFEKEIKTSKNTIKKQSNKLLEMEGRLESVTEKRDELVNICKQFYELSKSCKKQDPKLEKLLKQFRDSENYLKQ